LNGFSTLKVLRYVTVVELDDLEGGMLDLPRGVKTRAPVREHYFLTHPLKLVFPIGELHLSGFTVKVNPHGYVTGIELLWVGVVSIFYLIPPY
jgi:hypothetical protein